MPAPRLAINGSTIMKNLVLLALLAVACFYGYEKYKAARLSGASLVVADESAAQLSGPRGTSRQLSSQFKCDGRTHCSDMTSCAEATYFIQHCPNTRMDGDNDGEPCESQWCKPALLVR